ncbi:unnamed protein product [Rotaria magnacalcarata]|uniref:CWH43-like N-terminal domain-containing protein n=1 Tax=Rotaria magnacalcarata TaxID=392030 RepID=A0A820CAJ1_9BILA|nr:unnamed protein product [Rotaria magnacalcarata]CAF4220575.1 unnamed protein product [Rotaria magnacalcarata]
MMNIGNTLVWFRILLILPFTSILTFVLTLIICSQIPNNIEPDQNLPQISELGTGQAHNYFMSGFIVLIPQMLIMFIGRLQFLIQSQTIIHRAIIYCIHVIAIVSGIFVLIMAIVSLDDRPHIHDIGAIGTFGSISIYCILHTILIIYLFIHRSKATEHTNIIFPLWFLGCTIIVITCSIIWVITFASIPEYIAAGTPFLYFLAFAPQFWTKAKQIQHVTNLNFAGHYSSRTEIKSAYEMS